MINAAFRDFPKDESRLSTALFSQKSSKMPVDIGVSRPFNIVAIANPLADL
jgi:hypothetical protein